MIQTFWLAPTEMMQVALRRYSRSEGADFTCAGGYHSAMSNVSVVPGTYEVRDRRRYLVTTETVPSDDDPRWPTSCDACGYVFVDEDAHRLWQAQLYERSDTGDLVTLREAPVGACWDAWWLPDDFRGPDGIALTVQCPGQHAWQVDARASNCGRPDDDAHQCWVRHGDPRQCHVTVDKDGDTCSAGAGSIVVPGWHGFLRDGQLVEC